ncbi:type IV pilin [Halobellus litoreus]|uniref:Type IV pilin n=1 Tax=Halobellus litoreus TaxID=755310 RepID=A0ABD6DX27_9EURY|nr:type IV pilin N-terminal domain-containing protein [Halobellus litoreus]
MRLKEFFTDDDAVSPVIGVILMVAITVILAAVIGTFVLNLGQGINQSSPQASFGFDYNDTTEVIVTHQTGDSIDSNRLNVTGFSDGNPEPWGGDVTVSAGDSETFNNDGNWESETLRVVWTSQNGETSATLSQSTAPDNS